MKIDSFDKNRLKSIIIDWQQVFPRSIFIDFQFNQSLFTETYPLLSIIDSIDCTSRDYKDYTRIPFMSYRPRLS